MLVYLGTIAICTIFGFLSDKSNKTYGKYYFFTALIPFIVLFCVSGFRYNVGMDFKYTYVYTFEKILSGSRNVRADIGFYLLNKIIIFLGGSVQWIFIITSFIINFFVIRSIFCQSKNKMLSFFIYICGTFFFFSLNGIRQSIAISIFYYSLKYIENKRFDKYLLCNIIGCLFHNSAIIFIPLYFILSKEYKTYKKIIVIVMCFIFSSLIMPFVQQVLYSTKYKMYLTNGAYSALEKFNVSTIINIIIWLFYEILLKKKYKKDIIYSKCHLVGIIVSIFVTKIPLAMRIFMSFRYIEFLSVPNLLEKIKMKQTYKKFILIGIMISYFVYFIYGVYIKNGNTVLPYNTIFFN